MLDQVNSQRVIVQDIHMPFLSMVVFMVKCALSADLIGWGVAVIGIALTASAVIWVMRILRSA